MIKVNMDQLVGRIVHLYGVDCNHFKIGNGTDTIVLEAVEDPNDGYRSSLDYVKLNNVKDLGNLIFPYEPVAKVRITENDGKYYFTDENGHVWLTFGTDHADDYYPCFVFRWTPSKNTLDDFITGCKTEF